MFDFHPIAYKEYREAYRRYLKIDWKLGEDFESEVNAALAVIDRAPDRWPQQVPGVRKYVLDRFPYLIFYQVLPTHFKVLAVYHGKRRPYGWIRRLADGR
jgi:toxin ParE1/3/4